MMGPGIGKKGVRWIFMLLLVLPSGMWADVLVTVRVDADKPIRTIPEDFCGLSFEKIGRAHV